MSLFGKEKAPAKRLVAVLTCNKRAFREKAQAQRETWVDAVSHLIDVRFFVGNRIGELPGKDEVFLDVDDSYDGLPLKVQGICRYAVDHGYTYVTKVDDDVYVVPQRLFGLPIQGDYCGRFRAAPNDQYPAHYASGFSYTLSARAANIIAEQEWNGDWCDERFVANTLAMNEIWGHNDSVNYVVTGPHHPARDAANIDGLRKGTFYCQFAPQAIRQMHEYFKDMPVIPKFPGFTYVPQVKVTREILMQKPKDHYIHGSYYHPDQARQT